MSAEYAGEICKTRHCSSSCWKHHAAEETTCHCFLVLHSSVVLCRCQTPSLIQRVEKPRNMHTLALVSLVQSWALCSAQVSHAVKAVTGGYCAEEVPGV